MAQIFIFGASTTYGVGAEDAGWADLIKRNLHQTMYAKGGVGEIYNFAKPGATADFVTKTFKHHIEQYSKNRKKIAILSVGMNNSRADGSSDNYISSVGDFKIEMEELLRQMKEKVHHVLCVGYTSVDESKTAPKHNPISGGVSYFWNNRIQEFNEAFAGACEKEGIPFVAIDTTPEAWKKEYQYSDGLHPNQKGHNFIFEKVFPKLKQLL